MRAIAELGVIEMIEKIYKKNTWSLAIIVKQGKNVIAGQM